MKVVTGSIDFTFQSRNAEPTFKVPGQIEWKTCRGCKKGVLGTKMAAHEAKCLEKKNF